MKKFFFVIALVCFSGSLVTGVAAEEVMKFGYVDIQKVIFTSENGKQQIQGVKAFQEKRQQQISDKENQLNQLEKDILKQSFSLTDEAKMIKGEEIRKLKLELKRLLEDSEYELDKRKKEALAAINRSVVKLIQKLGKEEGYALIMEVTGSNVVYANTKFDLTDRVAAMYDGK